MGYTPENNPYIDGDPYSYDLKWIVKEINKQRAPEEEAARAEAAANAAETAANAAEETAANLSASVAEDVERAENAAGRAETSAVSAKYFLDTLGEEVAPAVSDWLDENITQPTNPVIDASLSVSGAAADAKVTGDKINDLKRIAPTPVYTWGRKTITNAGVISNSNYQVLSDIIPCHSGDKIINNTATRDGNGIYFTMSICTYSNGVFQSKIGILSDREYIIPENIDGFRINFGRAPASGVQFTDADLNYIVVNYFMQAVSYQTEIEIKNELTELENYVSSLEGKYFVYTEYEESAHYWTASGALDTSTLTHSQLLKIIPNKKFYMGTIANQEIIGAFFDLNKNWLAPMRTSEATIYPQPSPSKGDGTFDFCDIYEITPPEGAYFISINLRVTSHKIRQSISSEPVMWLNDSGNIYADADTLFTKFKNKKLCVIGASTAMIDRMYNGTLNQYLCGWEEYLAPYYNGYEVFGYSGGAMGTGFDTYESIYTGIVTEAVDLSGFDDFIILNTKNGLTTTGVGSYGTIETPPAEHDTYMGALRNIIEYIYTQNKKANIYLTTLQRDERFYNGTATARAIYNEASEKTRELGAMLGIPVIDLERISNFNNRTYYDPNDPTGGYTYDGTHFNQSGNRQIGLTIRKEVLGC